MCVIGLNRRGLWSQLVVAGLGYYGSQRAFKEYDAEMIYQLRIICLVVRAPSPARRGGFRRKKKTLPVPTAPWPGFQRTPCC